MLEETAQVLTVDGRLATVAMVRSEACGECGARDICHPTSGTTMQMEVENSVGAHPGDRVLITLPASSLLKATTLTYLFPAFIMVAGAAVGWSRTGTDMGAIIGAGVGFAASFLFVFIYSRRSKGEGLPTITRILQGRD